MSSLGQLRVVERAFASAEREVASEIQKAVRRGSKNTEANLRARQSRIRRVLSTLMDFVVAEGGPLRRMVEEAFDEGAEASEADMEAKGVSVVPRSEAWQTLPRSVGVILARLAGDLADAVDFIGRRSDDVLRQVVLEQAAVGEIAGSSRAKTARRIEEELKERGVKAFRDKAGREWSLSAYARMAANAARSEATTAATLDRLAENGVDLAQVSDHNSECEICGPFENRVFSISGTDTEFPPLIEAPPFHPFCRHILTAFIRGLSSLGGRSASGATGGGGGTPGEPPGEPPGGGEHPDELIRQAFEEGRALTPEELERITEHVAEAGFFPEPNVRVRGWMIGREYRGRTLERGDMIDAGAQHYLRHVDRRPEWSEGTTPDGYVESVLQVVRDPASGIFLSEYAPREQIVLSFIGRSGSQRGPAGHEWILVEYRPDIGRWVTAFQPEKGLDHLQASEERRDGRWIRRPVGETE